MSDSPPSNRSFGLLFFVVSAVVGLISWHRGTSLYPVAFVLSFAFLIAALAFPGVLRPLNRAWMAFALLLHKIMSPVIMGAIFFGVFTPVAIFMRVRKRDLMKRRFEPTLESYWIVRVPPGPPPESMSNQF